MEMPRRRCHKPITLERSRTIIIITTSSTSKTNQLPSSCLVIEPFRHLWKSSAFPAVSTSSRPATAKPREVDPSTTQDQPRQISFERYRDVERFGRHLLRLLAYIAQCRLRIVARNPSAREGERRKRAQPAARPVSQQAGHK